MIEAVTFDFWGTLYQGGDFRALRLRLLEDTLNRLLRPRERGDLEEAYSCAGPLMALAKIRALGLLHALYRKVYAPESVYHETVTEGLAQKAADAVLIKECYERLRLQIKALDAKMAPTLALPKKIHPAEHESIQLALQLKADVLLLDDWDARQVAETNFKALKADSVVKGTLGVIVTACQERIIAPEQAIGLLEDIKLRRDIWISAKLCDQVIRTIRSMASDNT